MNWLISYPSISLTLMFLYMLMCLFPTFYFLFKMIYSPYHSQGGTKSKKQEAYKRYLVQ